MRLIYLRCIKNNRKTLGKNNKDYIPKTVFFVSLTHPPSPCRVSRHLTTPCKHHSVALSAELPGFNSLIMRKQKTWHSDNRNTCQRMQLVKMLRQFSLQNRTWPQTQLNRAMFTFLSLPLPFITGGLFSLLGHRGAIYRQAHTLGR